MYIRQEGRYLYFQNDTGDEVRYDLKEKQMESKNRYLEWIPRKQLYKFFKGKSIENLKAHPTCTEATAVKFYRIFKSIIASIKNSSRHKGSTFSYFLSKFSEYSVVEEYESLGINYNERHIRDYRSLKGANKDVIKVLQKIRTRTIPAAVIKRNVTLDNLCFAEEKINFFSAICRIMLDEDYNEDEIWSILEDFNYREDIWTDLVKTYNYDMKALMNYLIKYLIPFENCKPYNSIILLRDYYRMANEIGRKVKRYPKYLKSMHDIIEANYKSFKKEHDLEKFKEMIRPELEYADKEYCIIVPKEPKDIIDEGTQLNHCVSSYVDKVIQGKTYIVFLRDPKQLDSSLVTVEIENNAITQAKGRYNRKLEERESQFLNKYKEVMKLNIATHL
jgi:hypothetical protein